MGHSFAEDNEPCNGETEKSVSGVAAMDFIDHGSEVSIEFQTPLGQKTNIETQFIGYDNKRHIYYSLPKMPPADMALYLQPQFWAFVTTTSDRGEGAIVKFKTQIDFVITQHVSLLVLKLPEQAVLFQLRKEMRYQLNIKAKLLMEKRKLEIELRNISDNGCGFSYRGIVPVLTSGADYTIEVSCPNTKEIFLLEGIIRNHRVHRGRQEYGLQFTSEGKKTELSLLSKLEFNGAKMVFQKPEPQDNEAASDD